MARVRFRPSHQRRTRATTLVLSIDGQELQIPYPIGVPLRSKVRCADNRVQVVLEHDSGVVVVHWRKRFLMLVTIG